MKKYLIACVVPLSAFIIGAVIFIHNTVQLGGISALGRLTFSIGNELRLKQETALLAGLALAFVGVVMLIAVLHVWFTVKLVTAFPKMNLPMNLMAAVYPYIYILIVIFLGERSETGADYGPVEYIFDLATSAGIILFAVGIISAGIVSAFILNMSGVLSAKRGAWLNMMIKLIHIPAYLLYFLIGLMGFFTIVHFIGIFLLIPMIIIDLLTIIVSGTYALAAVMNMKKRGVIGTGTAAGLAVFSYLYCVDVIAAIVMFALCRKHERKVEMIVERYREGE